MIFFCQSAKKKQKQKQTRTIFGAHIIVFCVVSCDIGGFDSIFRIELLDKVENSWE